MGKELWETVVQARQLCSEGIQNGCQHDPVWFC